MEFQALGTVRLVRDGEAVDLGSRKLRTLLSLLLLDVNEFVATERLLHGLWGDDAAGKESTLWVYVSRLRTALEPDRGERSENGPLRTLPGGYSLVCDPERYDVARFEQLVEAGRSIAATDPAAAAELFVEAVGLWRGPAFDGIDEPSISAESTRLEEVRTSALEDRFDAELRCGRDRELVAGLEALRTAHPYRERPVSQLMLALYRSGRAVEALRTFGRFRTTLGEELGLEPSPEIRRLEEQILLHDERLVVRSDRTEDAPTPRPRDNPFNGLRPFTESEADRYFGRDAMIASILRAITEDQRLIAVVGASGSGKSSLVRAGVVPAVAKAADQTARTWTTAAMVPGAHPFAELESSLLHATLDAPASLDEQLRGGTDGALRAVLRVLPDSDARMLLVVDQFEELFTLVDDEERDRFLDNLVTLVDDPRRRVTVLITLRADFYGHALRHPAFGARLSGSVQNVTPMSVEELTAAAIEPARTARIHLESELVTELIREVGTQPGSLPLFQFALTELYENRRSDTLYLADHREAGGMHGVLGRRAERLFGDFDEVQREATRQLLLRLVTIAESGEVAARRASAREILSLPVEAPVVGSVIETLGEHRLLTFDSERLDGSPTVEIAHEALIDGWQRLAEWIDAARGDLLRRASLDLAMREWELAGHDPDYLPVGSRLVDLAGDDSSVIDLTADERSFLDAARRHDEDRNAPETRPRSPRRWIAAGVAVVVAVVAAVLLLPSDEATPRLAFVPPLGAGAWDENIETGLRDAGRDLGVEVIDFGPQIVPHERLDDLADDGVELFVSTGLAVSAFANWIAEHPEVRFGIVDGPPGALGVSNVTFANEEGAFVAGAVAALHSTTRTVGYVGGSVLVDDFRAGFEAGATHVDPSVRVLAAHVQPEDEPSDRYAYSFWDGATARAYAAEMYVRGADVVFHAAGGAGDGVLLAAAAHTQATGDHVWFVGVDNDQWLEADSSLRPHVLTSMIKRGDRAAQALVAEMLSSDDHEQLTWGVGDGAFEFSRRGDNLSGAASDAIDELSTAIGDGSIEVPDEPTGELIEFDPILDPVAGGDVPGEVDAHVQAYFDGLAAGDLTAVVGSFANDPVVTMIAAGGVPATQALRVDETLLAEWTSQRVEIDTIVCVEVEQLPGDRSTIDCGYRLRDRLAIAAETPGSDGRTRFVVSPDGLDTANVGLHVDYLRRRTAFGEWLDATGIGEIEHTTDLPSFSAAGGRMVLEEAETWAAACSLQGAGACGPDS